MTMPAEKYADTAQTVLVVNDSPVAMAVICGVVKASGQYQLVGQATTGRQGIEMALRLRPALILLDMHMPDITGVDVTREVMSLKPTRILICSASISRNVKYMFEAMNYGALDYTKTPVVNARPGTVVTRNDLLEAGGNLLHKMSVLTRLQLKQKPQTVVTVPEEKPVQSAFQFKSEVHTEKLPLIVIGASTGGPTALKYLLRAIPSNIPAAVIIVQHIEKGFTAGLAQWLSQTTQHQVSEAREGETPKAGHVYVSQGGRNNLLMTRSGRLRYEPSGKAIYYPNINTFFKTAAEVKGKYCCGIILTGLGDDGADGLGVIAREGGLLLVQKPSSATVDSMPAAAIKQNRLNFGHDLADIGMSVCRWLKSLEVERGAVSV